MKRHDSANLWVFFSFCFYFGWLEAIFKTSYFSMVILSIYWIIQIIYSTKENHYLKIQVASEETSQNWSCINSKQSETISWNKDYDRQKVDLEFFIHQFVQIVSIPDTGTRCSQKAVFLKYYLKVSIMDRSNYDMFTFLSNIMKKPMVKVRT